jgi:Carboxypeptidase regulatory-like domain
MVRYAIRLGVMAIVLAASAVFVGVVVDESGAVLPTAEVVFTGESGTIISHADPSGSVNVDLEAGKYVVTVSANGFDTTRLVDFSVPGPTADAFRVILKADELMYRPENLVPLIAVPTVPSELPNVIKNEPTRTSLPVAHPATTKRRSMRCLYLWRCSASEP